MTFARFFAELFGCWRWVRRAYGGKWMYVYIYNPVNASRWVIVPDDAEPTYREFPWRSGTAFEDYTT